jgi:hypothetical protein
LASLTPPKPSRLEKTSKVYIAVMMAPSRTIDRGLAADHAKLTPSRALQKSAPVLLAVSALIPRLSRP